MQLSGVVITYNEERNIDRCLRSLEFCDEIIVVDSESKDRTVEIAKQFTSKVYQVKWQGYVSQKNYATGLTEGDWVINVDADEVISEELRTEIQRTLGQSSKCSAYSVPRKTMHSGRWIRHGGWYPNRLVRLYRPNRGKWMGTELHERWETPDSVEPLNGHLIHYSFSSISDQVSRNNHYSSLGAEQLRQKGRHFSLVKLIGKPISKFLETYLLKRGFLDGYPGFIISISAAYSVFLKWAKLWEATRTEQQTGQDYVEWQKQN